jgi:hypothetical protein
MKGYFYKKKPSGQNSPNFNQLLFFELVDFYTRFLEIAGIYKVYFLKRHSYLVYSHMWLNLFEQYHKIEKKKKKKKKQNRSVIFHIFFNDRIAQKGVEFFLPKDM